MKPIKSKLPAGQRGSFYVTVTMLVLLGAAVTFALKVAPAYIGNSTLKNSMAAIMAKSDYKSMDIDEIRKELIKSMVVNSIEGFDAKNVVLKRESGNEYVDINYEVRSALVYNISVVIEFKNRFNK